MVSQFGPYSQFGHYYFQHKINLVITVKLLMKNAYEANSVYY